MKITRLRELIGLTGTLLLLAAFFHSPAAWSRALGWELVVAQAVGFVLVYLNSTQVIADKTFKILGWGLLGTTLVVAIVLLAFFGGS